MDGRRGAFPCIAAATIPTVLFILDTIVAKHALAKHELVLDHHDDDNNDPTLKHKRHNDQYTDLYKPLVNLQNATQEVDSSLYSSFFVAHC
jgi:hypothetical protein